MPGDLRLGCIRSQCTFIRMFRKWVSADAFIGEVTRASMAEENVLPSGKRLGYLNPER